MKMQNSKGKKKTLKKGKKRSQRDREKEIFEKALNKVCKTFNKAFGPPQLM